MTVLQSLVVDGFGFAVVFTVLIALSLVIKLISVIITSAQKKAPENQNDAVLEQESVQAAQFADGELKLFEVDEKTAALIMAIVSDESGIPLSQLRFQSIRLMK